MFGVTGVSHAGCMPRTQLSALNAVTPIHGKQSGVIPAPQSKATKSTDGKLRRSAVAANHQSGRRFDRSELNKKLYIT